VNDLLEKAALALATAIIGALVGWASTALTLTGRVAAIEASLQRIEQLLYVTPANRGLPPPAK
jgi:hypothetical protein